MDQDVLYIMLNNFYITWNGMFIGCSIIVCYSFGILCNIACLIIFVYITWTYCLQKMSNMMSYACCNHMPLSIMFDNRWRLHWNGMRIYSMLNHVLEQHMLEHILYRIYCCFWYSVDYVSHIANNIYIFIVGLSFVCK